MARAATAQAMARVRCDEVGHCGDGMDDGRTMEVKEVRRMHAQLLRWRARVNRRSADRGGGADTDENSDEPPFRLPRRAGRHRSRNSIDSVRLACVAAREGERARDAWLTFSMHH